MPATADQVRTVIDKYVQAWTTGDRELLLSIFADDAEWCDPVGTPAFTGRAGVAKFWDFAHQDASRKLTPRVQEIRVNGNEGILRFVMEVRVPARKQGLDLSIIDHFILNDAGKIRVAHAFWDETSVSKPEGLELFAPNIDEAYDK